VLFYFLAKKACTKQGGCGALVVKGQISNPLYRLRPLPAAPLAVRRRYLIVVPRPLPRCASQELYRGAQVAAPGAATLSQQEKNNSAESQRSRVNITGFICTVAG
jgi:hypothetical protein